VGLVSKGIGAADTLMFEGIAAIGVGLLHWRYLRREKLKREADMVVKEEEHPMQAV